MAWDVYELEAEASKARATYYDRTPSTLQAYLDAGSPALPNPGIASKPKSTRRRRRKNGSHK